MLCIITIYFYFYFCVSHFFLAKEFSRCSLSVIFSVTRTLLFVLKTICGSKFSKLFEIFSFLRFVDSAVRDDGHLLRPAALAAEVCDSIDDFDVRHDVAEDARELELKIRVKRKRFITFV